MEYYRNKASPVSYHMGPDTMDSFLCQQLLQHMRTDKDRGLSRGTGGNRADRQGQPNRSCFDEIAQRDRILITEP